MYLMTHPSILADWEILENIGLVYPSMVLGSLAHDPVGGMWQVLRMNLLNEYRMKNTRVGRGREGDSGERGHMYTYS